MASSLLLLLAVILAFAGGGGPWMTLATVIVAAAAGTRLPDLDAPLRLRHRSALLHGMLPLLVALMDRRTWPVAAGLGFGIGLHLAADLFPSKMRGFATVKLPLWGAVGAGPSYLWIAANTVGNLAVGALILARVADWQVRAGVLGGISVLGFAYLVRTEGGWCALALFGFVGWLAFR